jgi:hypothetical protein
MRFSARKRNICEWNCGKRDPNLFTFCAVPPSISPTERAELLRFSCAQQLRVVSASSLGGLAFHSDCQASQSQQGGIQPLHFLWRPISLLW